jgi:hypothetical protein
METSLDRVQFRPRTGFAAARRRLVPLIYREPKFHNSCAQIADGAAPILCNNTAGISSESFLVRPRARMIGSSTCTPGTSLPNRQNRFVFS